MWDHLDDVEELCCTAHELAVQETLLFLDARSLPLAVHPSLDRV